METGWAWEDIVHQLDQKLESCGQSCVATVTPDPNPHKDCVNSLFDCCHKRKDKNWFRPVRGTSICPSLVCLKHKTTSVVCSLAVAFNVGLSLTARAARPLTRVSQPRLRKGLISISAPA